MNRSFKLAEIASKYFENVVISHATKWTNQEYLQALNDYEFVVSVDTSAIHIREGLGLPALGLYGAFSVESRAKYYQFTKCIDVKNDCLFSPCFTHNEKPCTENKGGYAPCLSNYPYINEELEKYLKEINLI